MICICVITVNRHHFRHQLRGLPSGDDPGLRTHTTAPPLGHGNVADNLMRCRLEGKRLRGVFQSDVIPRPGQDGVYKAIDFRKLCGEPDVVAGWSFIVGECQKRALEVQDTTLVLSMAVDVREWEPQLVPAQRYNTTCWPM